ncbi:probable UDP-N-acetylglucosamine--peptide N-acetylglucosaminyltransferase SPINDLY [Beta vulgaris subsp. vulgaris]|uniref:probable UDP-N-acetylglucosamine--peptide N-acetylglucosaminyltransferase SPINDLY n=1 Tax=Beta vulgaris subsp. vulgaris TaxID=3555 RepID=UPI0020371CA6|nr:probable UDP-N-acetylglucosamine--peptide N-acetylglucosaminyltransferase SPINDLY [Beta vulgaris subsp. vulgaris]XP_019103323.2 probable UDP-N-acetylglucosamine--peptide N-acetylglucosaminyltransferase SPINDLY [Beta vulgaris subsp. vulgaris]XP_048495627.1 probable UDP-N-acetylglucosamine--peptide N-acetylglucosaminyltransferase SPINDLY [Beta vulgaris subsp. vulgaris]
MLKFDMAILFYELAFHFNPQCAEACNNLGVIYKDHENLDKAVKCYQMALSIKPSFSQSLNNLGVVFTVQGKMDAAASMIEKAIIANPTYAEAYNNLGDDCSSVVNASSTIKMKKNYCGLGHGISLGRIIQVALSQKLS